MARVACQREGVGSAATMADMSPVFRTADGSLVVRSALDEAWEAPGSRDRACDARFQPTELRMVNTIASNAAWVDASRSRSTVRWLAALDRKTPHICRLERPRA